MTLPIQIIGIANDLKIVDIVGEDKKKYFSFSTVKLFKINNIEILSIRFPTELEGRNFIQKMIDDGVPFIDAERTYAYSDVMEFISEGKLHGKPVRSIWKNGEYVIHD